MHLKDIHLLRYSKTKIYKYFARVLFIIYHIEGCLVNIETHFILAIKLLLKGKNQIDYVNHH